MVSNIFIHDKTNQKPLWTSYASKVLKTAVDKIPKSEADQKRI
jgi:hypothetical protein